MTLESLIQRGQDGGSLHAHTSVAPLKPSNARASTSGSSSSPRSHERGSVEAPTSGPTSSGSAFSPRSHERGSVEAIFTGNITSDSALASPRSHERGSVEALRAQPVRHTHHMPLHAHTSVAPLKLGNASCLHRRSGPPSPRSHERGSVEAFFVKPRTLEAFSSLHAHTSVAPLKHGHITAEGGIGAELSTLTRAWLR